ncbi:response regulator transcription factor [Sphingosinicella sp. LHD-64]|uniref:response regulator transcription factor n=1 Tax=Sphingosinicella sp. LHD-64 TaxID=3072139 RepID=UPI0028108FED|nr:response regulator transcription factor [Sphingosinicella sp. LHD-64]MDQ8754661.1 response regulator transcription factor [Sphingosinicella sp. LHD-64]
MRIILLENDTGFHTSLGERLRSQGLAVDLARSVFDFYREMAVDGYDVAVIDVDLPCDSGLDVVSRLRRKDGIGIVLLTDRDAPGDRIEGYRRGADLCFAKPVDGAELAAALNSLSRRLGHANVGERDTVRSTMPWRLDPDRWMLEAPNGKSVKLSTAEMTVVRRLIEQPGTVASRGELRAALGYGQDRNDDQKLDALISRLRRKIERQAGCPAPVQTLHGRGHLFSDAIRVEVRLAARRPL